MTVPAGAVETREQATVLFCGDSGDGMQLTGSQFTLSTALAGNDLATFPDFPSEIRAPAVGINFDIGHYVAGTKGKDPRKVIEKYHKRIVSLHLKDRKASGPNGSCASPSPARRRRRWP